MRNIWVAVACAALVACGNDGMDKGSSDAAVNNGPDAKQFLDGPPTSNAMITVSGQATARDVNGAMPLTGVTVAAYRNANETTPIAMTTTDGQGNYSLTIQTNGEAIDGFLKATRQGYIATYLYPPYPLDIDFNMASVIMMTSGTFEQLSGLAQANQAYGDGKGLVALIVTDGTNPVGGAMVSSVPAASPAPARYNAAAGSVVFPSTQATSTYTDGIAYLFNLPPGKVTVSATKPNTTFRSHDVKAWPDELVTTVIVP